MTYYSTTWGDRNRPLDPPQQGMYYICDLHPSERDVEPRPPHIVVVEGCFYLRKEAAERRFRQLLCDPQHYEIVRVGEEHLAGVSA
jgi:hypothetical protein